MIDSTHLFAQQNNNVSIADDFDDADITEMAASTFHKILQKFPPCWIPANKIYRKLITKTSENSISTSGAYMCLLV